LSLTLLLCINTVSAVGNTIYVNASSGSDSYDGLNPTWNGTSGPKQNIKSATDSVNENGYVKIADGQYTGIQNTKISITRNMSIIGQSPKGTFIDGTGTNWIFSISNNVNVTLQNIKLTGGAAASGSAINNNGFCTVVNCLFENNAAANGENGESSYSYGGGNGGNGSDGGAIYNTGTLTVINSTFTKNSAGNGGSGGNGGEGRMDFDGGKGGDSGSGGSGGAIYNTGKATIINSRFSQNSAGNGGNGGNGGDGGTGGLFVPSDSNGGHGGLGGIGGSGGAIYNTGTLIITNTTLLNNTAGIGGNGGSGGKGGVAKYGGDGGNGGSSGQGGAVYNKGILAITSSSITYNSVKTGGSGGSAGLAPYGTNGEDGSKGPNGSGGAVHNSGTANINFNRIIENNAVGTTLFVEAGALDATLNWWGYNFDPSGEISGSGGTYNPWIVLTINSNPSTIDYKNSSTIIVDLLHDSNGLYHDPDDLLIPDGLIVEFNCTDGVVNPQTSITTNCVSNTSFTGLTPGISDVSAKVDDQTVSTNVKVNLIPTSTVINPASGYKKGNINLIVKVTDSESKPVSNGTVEFKVNNVVVGTATTDGNGVAHLSYIIPQSIGVYPLSAEYLGDTTYAGSININNLTVVQTPTKIVVDNVNGYNNKYLNLKATLKDVFGNLLPGQAVIFNIQNKKFPAVTNSEGVASIKYLPHGVGKYNVSLNYNGSNFYSHSQAKGLLTLDPAAYLNLKISTSNKNPKIGEKFTLTYHLENKGPNTAKNVTVIIPLPNSFQITGMGGSNLKNGISSISLMWTLKSATFGDNYYRISGEINHNGHYLFDSKITSLTYNLNTKTVTPITINTAKTLTSASKTYSPNVRTHSNSKTSLKAKSTTIPMQKTGLPITWLILLLMMIIGGTVIGKK
jgi:uncharacterized repeat protein (TIGR01451 family)